MVTIYNYSDLDENKINLIKKIAYETYPSPIYTDYFKDIQSIGDLADIHAIHPLAFSEWIALEHG